MALEMALENDGWCFWLDCDDTIENPELILETMENSDYDCYLMPYKINHLSGNLNKIRIHKAGWKWVGKVHEEVVPQVEDQSKVRGFLIDQVPVVHAPDDGKSNHDFHISLLKENIKTSEAGLTLTLLKSISIAYDLEKLFRTSIKRLQYIAMSMRSTIYLS